MTQVVTPGFIVEAIVTESAEGYFLLTLYKVLAITIDEYE